MSKLDAEILSRLVTDCPFPDVFTDVERSANGIVETPRKKIGHIRADHDGYRWWSTIWPCHRELETTEICQEIDRMYDALTAKNAFADLNALRRFCGARPEARVTPENDEEYNFYLEGQTCNFWIRLYLRGKDYNMYLYAYTK